MGAHIYPICTGTVVKVYEKNADCRKVCSLFYNNFRLQRREFMKILMSILLCLCLLLQIGCMGNPDTKESHQSGAETTLTEENMTDTERDSETTQSGAETTLTEENMTDTERDSETTAAVSGVDNNAPISMTNGELIDFLSLSSPHWYSYFMDGDDKKFYSLLFYPSSDKMEWSIGYYESEGENTFSGTYTIDNEEVFHAELSDALRDTKLQLSFTVDVLNTDTGKKEISLNITDSSLDKYQNLVNAPIRFTLDTSADYPLSTSVFTIKQKTQSENIEISVAADRQMTLKDNVLYDGSNEEYFRFSLLENTTAEDYLKSLSDENAQYNEVETLNGKKTESGFTYRVYYMDVEIRKGQTARHYKFFVTVDETDIILIDAYHYKFKDGSGEEDYLEKYILPVVGSFDIGKN